MILFVKYFQMRYYSKVEKDLDLHNASRGLEVATSFDFKAFRCGSIALRRVQKWGTILKYIFYSCSYGGFPG